MRAACPVRARGLLLRGRRLGGTLARSIPFVMFVVLLVGTVLAAPAAGGLGRNGASASASYLGPSEAVPAGAIDPTVTIANLDAQGKQLLRFDTSGDAVDAHDGMIAQFTHEGRTRYYWYGTMNDCGIGWLRTAIGGGDAPWCGFSVYSSDDLRTWVDEGTIASGEDPMWQQRCGYASCWRPKVVYNPNTNLYVAWANTLSGPSSYSAWTSPSPVGPWTYAGDPLVATNRGLGGLWNQDETLFVDSDGTGYVVLTDSAQGYRPTVEKLTEDYLGTTGERSAIPLTGAEAPTMVEHDGLYYMFVSYPNRGFGHTGTAYLTAEDPVGEWTFHETISTETFGGQPSHAARWQTTDGRTIFVFQTDLWRRRTLPYPQPYLNQGLAGFYLSPLEFSEDGTPSLRAAPQWSEQLRFVDSGVVPDLLEGSVHHAGVDQDWYPSCDVRRGTSRSFTFTAPRSGVLSGLRVNVARSEYPDADGALALIDESSPGRPVVATASVPASGPGWTARAYTWRPDVDVEAGATYRVALSSDATGHGDSCYGFVNAAGASTMGAGAVSYDSGTWIPTGETVRFDLGIEDARHPGATVTSDPRRLVDTTISGSYDTHLRVGGTRGIPVDVQAVWVNVTVDGPAADGELKAYPADGTVGDAVFHYRRGEVRAFSMLVRLGREGDLRVASSATTRVVVDVTGWITSSATDVGRLTVLPAATRAIDTRATGGTPGNRGVVHVPLGAAGVPADATAVLVNLTGAAPTADTYLAAFPTGSRWAGTSTLNLVRGEVARSNRTLVRLGTGRSIDVLNHAGSTDVIIDVVGYVTPTAGAAGLVVPLDPLGAVPVSGLVAGTRTFSADVGALRAGPRRPDASAVLLEVGHLGSPLDGFLTAYPSGSRRPPTSDLNYASGPTASTYNSVVVAVGDSAAVDVFVNKGGGTSELALLGYVT